jgi:hypothetical protein
MVIISLFSRAPDPERIKGIIWSLKLAALPASEKAGRPAWQSLLLWWGLFVGLMAGLYAYMTWFQFFGPATGL